MLRKFIKGVAEACRWRWLNIERMLEGISNVTVRTMVTALWFAVQFVISDILFGWLGFVLLLSKRSRQWLTNLVGWNTEEYGSVLSWEEES